MIRVKALGVTKNIRLLDVQYASNLGRNIISFGKLEKMRCVLEYRGGRRVMFSTPGGAPIMDVVRVNDVLVVEVLKDNFLDDFRTFGSPKEAIMSVVHDNGDRVQKNVQHGSLLQFHRRLGHLCYDTIIKIARDPASGIKLTDTKRVKFLACSKGKQTKKVQSRKDCGKNSPIDVIGGVSCSDLKSPMTPRDRLRNRYLINFADHRSNYCRVFLEKNEGRCCDRIQAILVVFFNNVLIVVSTSFVRTVVASTRLWMCKETNVSH